MRDHEVYDGVLVALLMDRSGNNEGWKAIKIRIGHVRCAIAQLDLMPALANVGCCPFGNFPRLPLGRSVNNQDIHEISSKTLLNQQRKSPSES